MPLTHPDMLATIAKFGRKQQFELSPVEVSLIGSLYKTHRPNKTAWQTAELMAASIACPEAGPGDREHEAMSVIIDQLDVEYWCATLEHD